ncbi:MAG TPA: NmrA/HSCARG family protein [Flavisolibacter sp.]|nr:NmrA/HSCARG family protein [Flavisolibacter sp.]
MTKKRTILVTGATGTQGGSVAKALLQRGEFSVRILTRNASSEKALALQGMGAEIAIGDMKDEESLERAMEGCYGVYGVTDYWEHFNREYTLGMNLIEAVAVSGISHFVLHTLPDYKAMSGGEFPVPQYDMKAALKAFSQDLRLPATYVQMGFYYENFFNLVAPLPDQFGVFQFGFPQGHAKLAMVSAEDIGPIVASVFADPQTYIGRTITAVGADETCDVYADTMTRVLNVPVHYNYVPHELYINLGYRHAEELGNMFEVQRLYISNRQKDWEESYKLNPDIQTFESWLHKNKERLLAQFEEHLIDEGVY